MILVDTSVWIEHLARGNARLVALLDEELVVVHPFVEGELACGNLHNRLEVFGLLQTLPRAELLAHGEVLGFLHDERLHGFGLSWIDVHLLASARASGCELWSLDASLTRSASRLGMGLR
jgi:hypothetical protein